jgi:hypothetical protein
VDRKEPSHWEMTYRQGKRLVTETATEMSLFKKLKALAGEEKYLIQETIALATFNDSPFDIRISVQKDGKGEWGITGMVERWHGADTS